MKNSAEGGTTTRPYASAIRTAAAAENRRRVVESATRLLRDGVIGTFSLDAVAKDAGLTRLTVYNQFGSRRGLLEAVFDELARTGGLHRLAEATKLPDPLEGIDRVVEIFCEFWSSDLAVGRLHDAMALDSEFGEALTLRNERRREILNVLVARVLGKGPNQRERRDAVDLIHAFTGFFMHRMLSRGRRPGAVCALIKTACRTAVMSNSDSRIDADRRARVQR